MCSSSYPRSVPPCGRPLERASPRWVRRLCFASVCRAAHGGCRSIPAPKPVELTSPFPLDRYDQNVDRWINPASPGYDQPIFSDAAQRAHFEALFARYFGTAAHDPSPLEPGVRQRDGLS
ncbi:MAG: hypothetical protein WDN30_03295 [Pararobbsia sp.]